MSLEARYRRLLRLHPDSWRAEREEEMTATYLDAVPAGRTRPSTGDVFDVVRSAVRERVREQAEPAARGLRAAGILALTAMSAMSAAWLLTVEFTRHWNVPAGAERWGPQSPAAAVWLTWIAVAVAYPFLSRIWLRVAATAIFAGTAAMIPLVPRFSIDVWLDPRFMLPMLLLGAVALLASPSTSRMVRWLPASAALVTAVAVLPGRPWELAATYVGPMFDVLPAVGALFAVAAFAAVFFAALLRRPAMAWAALPFLLAVPVFMPHAITEAVSRWGLDRWALEWAMAPVVIGVAGLMAVAVLVSTVRTMLRRRVRGARG